MGDVNFCTLYRSEARNVQTGYTFLFSVCISSSVNNSFEEQQALLWLSQNGPTHFFFPSISHKHPHTSSHFTPLHHHHAPACSHTPITISVLTLLHHINFSCLKRLCFRSSFSSGLFRKACVQIHL